MVPHAGEGHLLSGDKSGNLRLWNVGTWQCIARLSPPQDAQSDGLNDGVITSLESLGSLVLGATYAQGVHVWDLRYNYSLPFWGEILQGWTIVQPSLILRRDGLSSSHTSSCAVAKMLLRHLMWLSLYKAGAVW